MITLFRRIRSKLLGDGKLGKYLVYAIGEILLVVVGILLALQLNNWNEERKDVRLGDQYLLGIQRDLYKDISQIDIMLAEQTKSISLINSIDSVFKNPIIFNPDIYHSFFNEPDTLNIYWLFHRGLSFRSIKGTYSSLIADGRTGLIKDRLLFDEIQEIYDEHHERVSSIYESLKSRDDLISWNYPYEKKYWSYGDLRQAKNDKVFLDLSEFTSIKYFYSKHLYDLKIKSQLVIDRIDRELNS